MTCPSCRQELEDPPPAACPNCGQRLDAAETEATSTLEGPLMAPRTEEIERDEQRPSAVSPNGEPPFVLGPAVLRDFVASARRALLAGGWLDASVAAAVAFLAVLCVGAVLTLAVVLQEPDVPAGRGPLFALSAIVILGLASLHVPVRIGELELSLLPLTAFALAAVAIAWAARGAVRRRDATTLQERAADGAKIGLPLALLCWLAAVVFDLEDGRDPISSDPLGALVFGGLWGALFGALGGISAGRSVRHLGSERLAVSKQRSAELYGGLVGGATMFVVAGILATAAGLIWIIAALVDQSAGPEGRAALAGLIYLIAFAPNLVVFLIAAALGAPVAIGAELSFEGNVIDQGSRYSLFDWPGGAPWYALLLLLIPLAACLLGGFVARRASPRARPAHTLAVAAGVFTLTLLVLALLGDVVATLATDQGVARIGVSGGHLLLLGLLWAGVVGYAGWRIAETPRASGAIPPSDGG